MARSYLIGNSHIDPVWLWRWQEGFSEILATFRSALDRMKEFPDFKYTSACASYYQFVEKIDPDMFAEIQMRVKEGRWCIVGGWFLQPDCNIPDGESLARHGLISQRYFKEKFGRIAKLGYNVDSFGHNAAIPKILRASGMTGYIFKRPSPKEQGDDKYLFNWESDDGSAVTAYRLCGYASSTMERIMKVKEVLDAQKHDGMIFYGVGNHGGGPTIELIEKIKQELPEGIFATPDEFFEHLDQKDIPTHAGELQHHARGCYSALSYVKKANRRCEQNLLAAEKLCAMASALTDYKYPSKKLNKAWKNLLFNQFHDVLCGCSIKSAYKDASYLFGEAMSVTEQEMYFAMQKIVLSIDTLGDHELPSRVNKNGKTWEHETLGVPVVIFNPHTWSIKACVNVNERASKVTDLNGNEVPFQIVRGEHTNLGDKYYTAFRAELPPLGYTTYRIFTKKVSEGYAPSSLFVSERWRRLENSKLRVELDASTGDISSLFDKELGEYIINEPCRAILLDESECDTWAHGMTSLGQTVACFGNARFEIVENGPVRATLRATVTHGDSTVTRDFSLLEGDSKVLVKATIDFHEKHRTLKFTFPMSEDRVTAKIPYGTIKREADTGEEPCGSFIVNGKLAVANDSKYGYDTESQELRLTVLRGAIYADHYGKRDSACEYMDQGISEFSYAVFAHRTLSDTEKTASELNFAPKVIMASFHHGSLPEALSCFACDDDELLVSAIKKAEDGDQALIRCFDMEGKEHSTKINLFGKDISVTVPHNSIRTFTEDGEELDLTEAPLIS